MIRILLTHDNFIKIVIHDKKIDLNKVRKLMLLGCKMFRQKRVKALTIEIDRQVIIDKHTLTYINKLFTLIKIPIILIAF